MATQLAKPVTRQLSPEQASQLLGFPCNRALVVTITSLGVSFRALGRHNEPQLVEWRDILAKTWGGCGLDQFRKDLR